MDKHDLTYLRAVLEKKKDTLLKKYQAHAVGIGYKYVNGKRTNEPSVVFFVHRKRPKKQLKKLGIPIIPSELYGLKSDVREIRSGFTVRSEKKKHRPFSGGVSGISVKEKGATGTLGIVNKKGEVLSNNHVLADESLTVNRTAEKGDPFIQPGYVDGGTEQDVVGELDRWVDLTPIGAGSCPIGTGTTKILNFLAKVFGRRGRFTYYVEENNYVDGAVGIAYDDVWESGVMGLDEVVDAKDPELGEHVQKRGRTTGLTKGIVTAVNVTVNVGGYQGFYTCKFVNQVAIEADAGAFSQPGDSVTGDTKLYWLCDGKLKYGEVKEAYLDYKLGHKIHVLSPLANHRLCNTLVWCPARIIDHGVRQVYQVTFHNGATVNITKDHSLFHVSNEKLVPITVEKIVKRNKGAVVVETLSPVNSYANDLPSPLTRWNAKQLLLFAEFCGLWLADGNYDDVEGTIRISTGNNPDVISFLSKVASELYEPQATHRIALEILRGKHLEFNTLTDAARYYAEQYKVSPSSFFDAYYRLRDKKLHIKHSYTLKHKSKGDYRLYSEKLQSLMLTLGFAGTSATKRVPEWLFTAPKEVIAAFLRGYFTGDGSIYKRADNRIIVDCASCCRERLEDVKILLLRFGIRSNIDSGYIPKKFSNRRQYKLKIEWGSSVNRFLDEIGFRRKSPLMMIKRNERVERTMRISSIRSIVPLGLRHVYDLKVERTEAFITAQGVLCHNSGSAVLTLSTPLTLVGLLFAGGKDSSGRDVTIASPYGYVEKYLDFTV